MLPPTTLVRFFSKRNSGLLLFFSLQLNENRPSSFLPAFWMRERDFGEAEGIYKREAAAARSGSKTDAGATAAAAAAVAEDTAAVFLNFACTRRCVRLSTSLSLGPTASCSRSSVLFFVSPSLSRTYLLSGLNEIKSQCLEFF